MSNKTWDNLPQCNFVGRIVFKAFFKAGNGQLQIMLFGNCVLSTQKGIPGLTSVLAFILNTYPWAWATTLMYLSLSLISSRSEKKNGSCWLKKKLIQMNVG